MFVIHLQRHLQQIFLIVNYINIPREDSVTSLLKSYIDLNIEFIKKLITVDMQMLMKYDLLIQDLLFYSAILNGHQALENTWKILVMLT